jgi:hypothetical protein
MAIWVWKKTSVSELWHISALGSLWRIALFFNLFASKYNLYNRGQIAVPVSNLRQDLRSASGNLSLLSSMVGACETIHNEYVTAVTSVCSEML